MSIISFWNKGREQVGKTLSIAAIATYMAIEHNYKILVLSTSYKDKTLDNCFWPEKALEPQKKKKNFGLFGPNTNNTYLGNGMEGIIPMMKSSKLAPELVTNYTKIIFKDRLEVVPTFCGAEEDYEDAKSMYADIATIASRYYDMVFVDIDESIGEENVNHILERSTLVMATISQRLSTMKEFIEIRNQNPLFSTPKVDMIDIQNTT